MKKQKRIRVQVPLSADLFSVLCQIAESSDRSGAWVIKDMIRAGLADLEGFCAWRREALLLAGRVRWRPKAKGSGVHVRAQVLIGLDMWQRLSMVARAERRKECTMAALLVMYGRMLATEREIACESSKN